MTPFCHLRSEACLPCSCCSEEELMVWWTVSSPLYTKLASSLYIKLQIVRFFVLKNCAYIATKVAIFSISHITSFPLTKDMGAWQSCVVYSISRCTFFFTQPLLSPSLKKITVYFLVKRLSIPYVKAKRSTKYTYFGIAWTLEYPIRSFYTSMIGFGKPYWIIWMWNISFKCNREIKYDAPLNTFMFQTQ